MVLKTRCRMVMVPYRTRYHRYRSASMQILLRGEFHRKRQKVLRFTFYVRKQLLSHCVLIYMCCLLLHSDIEHVLSPQNYINSLSIPENLVYIQSHQRNCILCIFFYKHFSFANLITAYGLTVYRLSNKITTITD